MKIINYIYIRDLIIIFWYTFKKKLFFNNRYLENSLSLEKIENKKKLKLSSLWIS